MRMEATSSGRGWGLTSSGRGALQWATLLGGIDPSAASLSSWTSVMEDGLHSDIAALGFRRKNGKGGEGEGGDEREQEGK